MKDFFRFIFKHSTIVIILTILITLFFGFFLKDLKVDPSPEKLIPENNEINKMLEEYGTESDSDGVLLIAIESNDIFNLEGLQAFERLIHKIESYPGIKPGINPFSAVLFDKDKGRLTVRTISPEGKAPKTKEELAVFKNNIMNNPFFRNVIISADGSLLCAIFSSSIATDKIEDFINFYSANKIELERYYTVYETGDVPISVRSNFYMRRELVKLFSLALLFIMASFYFGFKSKRAVFLPLSVVVIGMIWTLGFMAIMQFEINLICLAIPPLVLSIGSSYTIHVLNQYFSDAKPHKSDKKQIIDAVSHIVKTILLACLTTVIGFMSLLLTSLEQTRQFGITTGFGIIATMLLSIIYLPSVLYKLPVPSIKQHKNIKTGFFSLCMEKIGTWVCKAKYLFVILFALIIGLFLFTYPLIPPQEDYLSYFPEDDFLIKETDYIISKIGGYQTLNITLTAPDNEKNYFLKPEVLSKIFEFENKIIKYPDVANVSSISFYIAELNNILNGNREIPSNKGLINLISRFLKMIRKTDSKNIALMQLSNEDFSRVTITFRVFNSKMNKLITGEYLRNLINDIEDSAKTDLSEYKPELWSVEMRFLSIFDLYKKDQLTSIIFAIVLVFAVSLIAFRSFKYGLLTLIPLLAGLMLNFIFMAFLKIPLDMLTLTVTSIVIGVGVDDTIHYVIRFRKNYKKLGRVESAIVNTHLEAGRPIMHTTISIVGGLIFLLLSSFLGIAYFGVLICITLSFTMLGTLFLLPAVLCFIIKEK